MQIFNANRLKKYLEQTTANWMRYKVNNLPASDFQPGPAIKNGQFWTKRSAAPYRLFGYSCHDYVEWCRRPCGEWQRKRAWRFLESQHHAGILHEALPSWSPFCSGRPFADSWKYNKETSTITKGNHRLRYVVETNDCRTGVVLAAGGPSLRVQPESGRNSRRFKKTIT